MTPPTDNTFRAYCQPKLRPEHDFFYCDKGNNSNHTAVKVISLVHCASTINVPSACKVTVNNSLTENSLNMVQMKNTFLANKGNKSNCTDAEVIVLQHHTSPHIALYRCQVTKEK